MQPALCTCSNSPLAVLKSLLKLTTLVTCDHSLSIQSKTNFCIQKDIPLQFQYLHLVIILEPKQSVTNYQTRDGCPSFLSLAVPVALRVLRRVISCSAVAQQWVNGDISSQTKWANFIYLQNRIP